MRTYAYLRARCLSLQAGRLISDGLLGFQHSPLDAVPSPSITGASSLGARDELGQYPLPFCLELLLHRSLFKLVFLLFKLHGSLHVAEFCGLARQPTQDGRSCFLHLRVTRASSRGARDELGRTPKRALACPLPFCLELLLHRSLFKLVFFLLKLHGSLHVAEFCGLAGQFTQDGGLYLLLLVLLRCLVLSLGCLLHHSSPLVVEFC